MDIPDTAHDLPLAQKLAHLADILRSNSSRGLHFASNVYDHENYLAIQNVAMELFALATDQTLEEVEPLRKKHFSWPAPYPTGDGAVIDEEGCILLIRRADNNKWAMPGGALEAGETPAAGVIREVLEETGVSCEPIALVGIHDGHLHNSSSPHHLYHITFLCRPLKDIPVVEPPSHALEVKEIAWFTEDTLPDDLDPNHITRIPEAFRVMKGDMKAYFDWNG